MSRPHIIVYGTVFLACIILINHYLNGMAGAGAFQWISVPLAQWTGGLSMVYLYITLMISPVYHVFPRLPFRKLLVHSRKALGISAFILALFHSVSGYISFQGVSGLVYFGPEYVNSIVVGSLALGILLMLTITSLDALHALLATYWKPIHRAVYGAGFLILVHVFMVTTHLGKFEFPLLVIQFLLLGVLCVLESIRFGDYCKKMLPSVHVYAIQFVSISISCGLLFWASFLRYHPH